MKHFLALLFLCGLLAGCNNSKQAEVLKVLQFNIWQEGAVVPNGYDAVVQQIIDSEADIVMLSEVRNYNDSRFCDRIVQSLSEKGHVFYSFFSFDSGILSRFPIKESSTIYPLANDHGSMYRALVEIGNCEVAIYTAHLDYLNCSYYMVKGYHSSTWEKLLAPVIDVDRILADNVASQRDDAIQIFLKEAQLDKDQGRIVLLGGDFNEPSHLDWTKETKDLFDRQGLVIPWTVTSLLEKAGYVDAYRKKYPNPLSHPGFTYPSDCPDMPESKIIWAPDADERERIDYIFYSPSPNLVLQDMIIWGPKKSICRSKRVEETFEDKFAIGNSIWPTDHKAVLAVFELK